MTPPKPARARAGRAAQAAPGEEDGNERQRAADELFYSDEFSADELALVAAFVSDPSLDDELWLQRVLNHRLFRFLDEPDEDREIELATLVKVAEALSRGTGRVARLLRDKRALSGAAADGISGAIANMLDEFGTELGIQL